MTDFLTVKPLKTFDAGTGLKTVLSEPFPIEAGHARELKAGGLVEIVEAAEKKPKTDEKPKDDKPKDENKTVTRSQKKD